MAELQRGPCPVCDTDQPLKKDGTVYKHGECAGAGQAPAVDPLSEEADEGLDWRDDIGEVTEATTIPPVATTGSTDTKLMLVGETVPELIRMKQPGQIKRLPPLPPAQDGPIRDFGGAKAYAWQMTVKSPAIYLSDAGWHEANGKLAARRVAEDGHTVTGEPQWDGVVGGGSVPGTVLLTYLVPIEG